MQITELRKYSKGLFDRKYDLLCEKFMIPFFNVSSITTQVTQIGLEKISQLFFHKLPPTKFNTSNERRVHRSYNATNNEELSVKPSQVTLLNGYLPKYAYVFTSEGKKGLVPKVCFTDTAYAVLETNLNITL
jgi:hypothetical protein